MNIDKKLEEIKKEYTDPEDVTTIRQWENDYRMYSEIVKLKDNFAIKNMLESHKNDIKHIDSRLNSDRSLLNDEGKLLLDKKNIYLEILAKFEEAQNMLDDIEKDINTKL